ncbi:MAG: bifunctional precorrin-2 dehydrogenase/sirohydrochlorin ferrochelatase [Dehalococcoidales bacterium]|nr:siroheme synthase [Dehalococcoidales bacterium]MDP6632829.1 bifunctional precorrin-2 dehydrogenase/sirohydrochlorin ferrochelatase [Dehalococcoidales bacterium]
MKDKKPNNIYYPISLNVRGRKCSVVGGGQVALRKVDTLLEHGADVQVISPDLCTELVSLAERKEIDTVTREYRPGDLKDAFVAIVATDNSKINRQIAAEAREQNVLVNVVDDADNSDFIAPSYLRRGGISIAISTSGESPALARKLRTMLEKDFGDEYGRLSVLIGQVRAKARQQNIRVSGDGWQEALDLEVLLGMLKKDGEEKVEATLLDSLKTRRQQTKD